MQIIAIYMKNKPSAKWSLYFVADDMEKAKAKTKMAIQQAKEIGYDSADAVIQKYNSAYDVPQTLDKIIPEKDYFN